MAEKHSGFKTSGIIESDVATGVSPLIIASTTKVTNLNADTLDGFHASDFVSSTSSIKGKATIPAGSVSVVVYHELGSIPTVFITPYHIDAVQGYVDETTITSTQFTIYIPVKQLSNVSFGYEAKI
uniref:Putative tail protein n=1 Tax=viral metagenome TaxID=1070528 RepID=A0A6M3IFI8_9ZZZZ